MNIDHTFILSILNNYHQVVQKGKKVKFWVPSHIGIHGNNKADMAAKSALQFKVAKYKYSLFIHIQNVLSDFIQIVFEKYFVMMEINFLVFKQSY